MLTRQLKLLKIYLHVDQRCQQKCKSKNLCSKSMGNHFLSIWTNSGLSLTKKHITLSPKITLQFFIWGTTFNRLKFMSIGKISVYKRKFKTISQILLHCGCQGSSRNGFLQLTLNLKGSSSHFG